MKAAGAGSGNALHPRDNIFNCTKKFNPFSGQLFFVLVSVSRFLARSPFHRLYFMRQNFPLIPLTPFEGIVRTSKGWFLSLRNDRFL